MDGVPVSDLHHVWDGLWPYLKTSAERFPHRQPYSEGDVLARLFARRQQLWIAWDTETAKPIGGVVTEIITDDQHPDKLFLSFPLVGGERFKDWGDQLWTLIRRWGLDKGCTHASGQGRKGWMRLFGFVECGKTDDGVTMFVRRLTR